MGCPACLDTAAASSINRNVGAIIIPPSVMYLRSQRRLVVLLTSRFINPLAQTLASTTTAASITVHASHHVPRRQHLHPQATESQARRQDDQSWPRPSASLQQRWRIQTSEHLFHC